MHYIKVKEVLNPAGAAVELANLSASITEQFSSWNGLQGFSQALFMLGRFFPHCGSSFFPTRHGSAFFAPDLSQFGIFVWALP